MSASPLLLKLRFQQQRWLDAAEAIAEFVGGEHPDTVDRLAELRWNFTREMLLHFACLETQLLQPMLADRRAGAAFAAARSSQDLVSVYGHLTRHAGRWHGLPPSDRWDEYRVAIAMLLRLVTVRIAAQEQGLFPLLPVQPGGTSRVATMAPLDYSAEAWKIRGLIYSDIAGKTALG